MKPIEGKILKTDFMAKRLLNNWSPGKKIALSREGETPKHAVKTSA
jgi:hypothetical protein